MESKLSSQCRHSLSRATQHYWDSLLRTNKAATKKYSIMNTKRNNTNNPSNTNNNVILPPSSSRSNRSNQRRLLLSNSVRQKTRLPITIRLGLIGACCGFAFQDLFRSKLLPYGPPNYNWGTRPTYTDLDTSNDSLMVKRTFICICK